MILLVNNQLVQDFMDKNTGISTGVDCGAMLGASVDTYYHELQTRAVPQYICNFNYWSDMKKRNLNEKLKAKGNSHSLSPFRGFSFPFDLLLLQGDRGDCFTAGTAVLS